MRWINLSVMTCVIFIAAGSLVCFAQQEKAPTKKKILLFSQSMGWRHSVVARPLTGELSHAEKIFKEVATKAGYEVYLSQDFHDLKKADQIEPFDAIALFATGEPPIDRKALLKWLRAGGALVGIHTATDLWYDWPEYGKIIGAYFGGHGGNNQDVTIKVEDPNHPSTRMLGSQWVLSDEIYQFKPGSFSRDNVKMLLSVDTSKMTDKQLKTHKMEAGKDYPIAWTNTEGKGRVFYTSLGHREDVWTDSTYQAHVLGGIAWALGLAK